MSSLDQARAYKNHCRDSSGLLCYVCFQSDYFREKDVAESYAFDIDDAPKFCFRCSPCFWAQVKAPSSDQKYLSHHLCSFWLAPHHLQKEVYVPSCNCECKPVPPD